MIRREGEGDRASEAAREVRLDRHALEPSQSQRFEGQRVFHGSGKRKQGGGDGEESACWGPPLAGMVAAIKARGELLGRGLCLKASRHMALHARCPLQWYLAISCLSYTCAS